MMVRRLGLIALGCVAALQVVPAMAHELFFTEFGSGKVRKYDTETGVLSDYVSGLKEPFGLVFDKAGNLYVASSGAGKIVKVSPSGSKSDFATGLGYPVGAGLDSEGNLYVSEYRPVNDPGSGKAPIWKFSPSGVKTLFASGIIGATEIIFQGTTLLTTNYAQGSGTAVYGVTSEGIVGSTVPYSPTGFRAPYGLANGVGAATPDSSSDFYIGDNGTGKIYKKALNTSPTLFATQSRGLMGIRFDPDGQLWALNMDKGQLIRFGPALGSMPGAATIVLTGLKNPTSLTFK